MHCDQTTAVLSSLIRCLCYRLSLLPPPRMFWRLLLFVCLSVTTFRKKLLNASSRTFYHTCLWTRKNRPRKTIRFRGLCNSFYLSRAKKSRLIDWLIDYILGIICLPIRNSGSRNFLKTFSVLRDMAFFHNLAYIAGKSDRIFMKILSRMYPWIMIVQLNFGSIADPDYDTDSGCRLDSPWRRYYDLWLLLLCHIFVIDKMRATL